MKKIIALPNSIYEVEYENEKNIPALGIALDWESVQLPRVGWTML